jgi:hypothetical protein
MGDFRIEITAIGGHGCQRDRGDGQKVLGCLRVGCPDCETRRFLQTLHRFGVSIKAAEITHWPGDPNEVRDDLMTAIRTGTFPEHPSRRPAKLSSEPTASSEGRDPA